MPRKAATKKAPDAIPAQVPSKDATESQGRVLEYVRGNLDASPPEPSFVFWYGGVRGGKSWGATMALLEHALRRPRGRYLVLAYTERLALSIFGDCLERIATDQMGMEVKLSRSAGNMLARLPLLNVEVMFKGADKMGRDKAIQGLTLDGLICDEINNLDRATIRQAENRLSKPGPLRVYTANKQHAAHWTNRKIADKIRSGEINGLLVDSVARENHHVPESFFSGREDELEGQELARFMRNEFALGAPPVYMPCLNPMDVEPDDGSRQYVTAINAHAGGIDLIRGHWQGKAEDPKRSFLITHDLSKGPMEELTEEDLGHPQRRTVLVNVEGTETLYRSLRSRYRMVGYKSDSTHSRRDVMQAACRAMLMEVVVDEDRMASPLTDALMSYHAWPNAEHGHIVAWEAISYLFSRPTLKYLSSSFQPCS